MGVLLAQASSAQLEDGRYSSSASAQGESNSDSSSDLGEDDWQQQFKDKNAKVDSGDEKEEVKVIELEPVKTEEKINPFPGQEIEGEKKAPIMNLPSALDTFNPLKKFYASINKTKPKQALNIDRIVKEQTKQNQPKPVEKIQLVPEPKDSDLSQKKQEGEATNSVGAEEKTIKKKPIMRQRQPRLVTNVAHTKYTILRKVVKRDFKMRLSEEDCDDYDLLWCDLGLPPERIMRMKPFQRTNHFPGMHALTRKNHLGKNLNNMRAKYPDAYDFYPQTWLLPQDVRQLKKDWNYIVAHKDPNIVLIVKPEASSQGKGIYLTREVDDIALDEHVVVQLYLNKPLLMDKLKFDLRLYVLVLGVNPLRIYLSKEGLARLSTKQYDQVNDINLTDMQMHLTNYSINKHSNQFEQNRVAILDSTGHKRSLKYTLRYMRKVVKGDDEKLMRDIKDIIVKTCISGQPALKCAFNQCQLDDFENSMCFQILGFDIMLDRDCKPYLLEVNHSPSFSTDSPLDEKVKGDLIKDTVRLLGLTKKRKALYRRNLQAHLDFRILHGKFLRLPQDLKEQYRAEFDTKRQEFEIENMGAFDQLFPCRDQDEQMHNEYESLIAYSQMIFDKNKPDFGKAKSLARKNQTDKKNISTNEKSWFMSPDSVKGGHANALSPQKNHNTTTLQQKSSNELENKNQQKQAQNAGQQKTNFLTRVSVQQEQALLQSQKGTGIIQMQQTGKGTDPQVLPAARGMPGTFKGQMESDVYNHIHHQNQHARQHQQYSCDHSQNHATDPSQSPNKANQNRRLNTADQQQLQMQMQIQQQQIIAQQQRQQILQGPAAANGQMIVHEYLPKVQNLIISKQNLELFPPTSINNQSTQAAYSKGTGSPSKTNRNIPIGQMTAQAVINSQTSLALTQNSLPDVNNPQAKQIQYKYQRGVKPTAGSNLGNISNINGHQSPTQHSSVHNSTHTPGPENQMQPSPRNNQYSNNRYANANLPPKTPSSPKVSQSIKQGSITEPHEYLQKQNSQLVNLVSVQGSADESNFSVIMRNQAGTGHNVCPNCMAKQNNSSMSPRANSSQQQQLAEFSSPHQNNNTQENIEDYQRAPMIIQSQQKPQSANRMKPQQSRAGRSVVQPPNQGVIKSSSGFSDGTNMNLLRQSQQFQQQQAASLQQQQQIVHLVAGQQQSQQLGQHLMLSGTLGATGNNMVTQGGSFMQKRRESQNGERENTQGSCHGQQNVTPYTLQNGMMSAAQMVTTQNKAYGTPETSNWNLQHNGMLANPALMNNFENGQQLSLDGPESILQVNQKLALEAEQKAMQARLQNVQVPNSQLSKNSDSNVQFNYKKGMPTPEFTAPYQVKPSQQHFIPPTSYRRSAAQPPQPTNPNANLFEQNSASKSASGSYSAAKAVRETSSPVRMNRGGQVAAPPKTESKDPINTQTIQHQQRYAPEKVKEAQVNAPDAGAKKSRSVAVSKTGNGRGGIASSTGGAVAGGGNNNNNGGFLRPKVLDFQPKSGQMDPLMVNRSRKASRTTYNFVKRY